MDILFFITLALLLVALYFVWFFWRQRNAYRKAYEVCQSLLNSTSQPEGLLPSMIRGAAIGILTGFLVKVLLNQIYGKSGNETTNE